MTSEDRQMLKDVHTCLVGEKLKGQKGLIDRVETCEVKIDVIEKKKADKWDWSKIFKLGIKFGTKAGGM
jgi:chaperonin cofactor prefoldin